MSTKPTRNQDHFGPTLEALLEHKDWLRRLARSLVFDSSQADDVVQQVFLSALKYRPSADRDLRPWLKVVATAVAKKIGRSEVRRTKREKKSAREEVLPAEEKIARLEANDTYRQLGEFLKELEEPYRAILLMHHFEGIPLDEVGKRMGLSRSTVRSRYKRGIELLRARLDSRYGDRTAWGLHLLPLVALSDSISVGATPCRVVRTGARKSLWGAAAAVFLSASGILLTAAVVGESGASTAPLETTQDSTASFPGRESVDPNPRRPYVAVGEESADSSSSHPQATESSTEASSQSKISPAVRGATHIGTGAVKPMQLVPGWEPPAASPSESAEDSVATEDNSQAQPVLLEYQKLKNGGAKAKRIR